MKKKLLIIGLLVIGLLIIIKVNVENKSSSFLSSPANNKNTQIKLSTLIIPHHDLAATDRDKVFESASKLVQPKTIILISPNHFDTGSNDIITTSKTWQLSDSQILPDTDKMNQLVSSGIVANDESAFSREHGITNILDPISKYFSDAKIIPIIIRQNTTQDIMKKLAPELENFCSDNCLLIVSVDFSHYQPGALAQIHDDLNIRALFNMDESLIWQAEVDSPQSLYTAIEWAKINNTNHFNLQENINSGKVANERDAESTSYVFGWYEIGETTKIEDQASFIIGGDMMFDRMIDYKFRGNDIYKSVANLGDRLFWGTDISLVNLEGPISSDPIEPDIRTNNLVFNFPPKTPDVLKWLHINSVSLANNHSGNAGASGLAYTKKVLIEKNINYIGQQSQFNDESIKRYQTGNVKISILAINLLETDNTLAEKIKQEKANGSFVIIFPHWGNEYHEQHSTSQQSMAHAWIDAGADLIIGSHPHVIQNAEIYKNKPIFYSLGNLLFDQTFSKETQRGLIIAGEITPNKLKLVLLPTVSINLQPQLLTGTEKTDLITKFRKNLGLENSNQTYGYDIIEINRN